MTKVTLWLIYVHIMEAVDVPGTFELYTKGSVNILTVLRILTFDGKILKCWMRNFHKWWFYVPWLMHLPISKLTNQWRIQGFLKEGTSTTKVGMPTYYCGQFPLWMEGGGDASLLPLRSADVNSTYLRLNRCSLVRNSLTFGFQICQSIKN